MAEQELIQAIGRLERAISRLETAPLSTRPATDPDLAQRYVILKEATATALARIDGLLATRGPENG